MNSLQINCDAVSVHVSPVYVPLHGAPGCQYSSGCWHARQSSSEIHESWWWRCDCNSTNDAGTCCTPYAPETNIYSMLYTVSTTFTFFIWSYMLKLWCIISSAPDGTQSCVGFNSYSCNVTIAVLTYCLTSFKLTVESQ